MKKILIFVLISFFLINCSNKKEQALYNIKDKIVADLIVLSSLAQMEYSKIKTFNKWEIPQSLVKTFYADYSILKKDQDKILIRGNCYVTIEGEYFEFAIENTITPTKNDIKYL